MFFFKKNLPFQIAFCKFEKCSFHASKQNGLDSVISSRLIHHVIFFISSIVSEAVGQTDLELQSRLMGHQFSFSPVYDENAYWTYVPWPLDNLGLIVAFQSGGQIETHFNVVPGNLVESFTDWKHNKDFKRIVL